MSVSPCPLSFQSVFDANGRPVAGAVISAFQGGTTSPVTVYSDPAGTVPFPQPFAASGAGRIPAIYLPAGTFRFRIATPQGAIVEDLDGIQGFVATTINQSITQTISGTPTGALQHFYGASIPSGWVRANGRTIGSAASGASELADPTTQALYVELWNADSTLAIAGGTRGPSATADFNAGKALALPDLRRKILVGLDGMGNGQIGGTLSMSALGQAVGEENHTLALAEMPVHTHVATTDSQGAHDHPNSATALAGQHTHTFAYASYDNTGGTTSNMGTAGVRNGFVSQEGTTDPSGSHGHPLDINTDGAHTHNVTVTNAGNGSSHNNVQPSSPVTILIKL